ncbi:unnamed protein product [Cuscuta epithymum]|jgi:hypothetical protein
MFILL